MQTTSPVDRRTPINTKAVKDRRALRFQSISDLRRDLDGLEAGHRAGTLRATGNWSAAQNFCHVAAFINFAYDGYPANLSDPPLLVRFLVKFMRNRFLYKSLPAGVQIPKVPGGTVGFDDVPFKEGLARFRKAIDRLDTSPPTKPNVLFGPLTHDEWRNLHLRHAELHLSFLHPR